MVEKKETDNFIRNDLPVIEYAADQFQSTLGRLFQDGMDHEFEVLLSAIRLS